MANVFGQDSRNVENGDGPPLRIAMVGPPWFEMPPAGYGGIESVVADLVNQLTDRGHEVVLIGAGEDRTRATRFIQVFPEPPTERLGDSVPEVMHAAAAAAALEDLDVDVVHDHTLAGPLLAPGREVPTVVTMHGPVDGELGEYYATLGNAVDVVAISHSQRSLNPKLNWVGTVHNAIDVSSFPFHERKSDYVLWLGRFSDEKGAHLAIEAAREAGMKLVLAGKCNEEAERDYFDAHVAPHLGPEVRYVGEADAQFKRELLGSARSLVFPIQWDEPFGMVMIEAMACGTPVVALRRGSVPEVVVHEQTGIVVDDPAELPVALQRADAIDPQACRRHAQLNFDLPVMAGQYERLYRDVLARTPGAPFPEPTTREQPSAQTGGKRTGRSVA